MVQLFSSTETGISAGGVPGALLPAPVDEGKQINDFETGGADEDEVFDVSFGRV